MKILVVGSGGREAAMVWALAQTPDIEIFCAPGNAGIAERAMCVPISATDIDSLLAFARDEYIDLTVVGPEAPLVAGIVDRFWAEGLFICGPSATAAQTEGSKSWFKYFLTWHDIPTAPFEVFDDYDEALVFIHERGAKSIVIKADGLMGGKGVTLPNTFKESASALNRLIKGSAGERVVIEDRLVGLERSAMAITDGKNVYMLPFTQDYKREGEDDTGRNTGGMGAHTLSLPKEEEAQLEQILRDVVTALAKDNCMYSGFIYLGFIMTDDGPMVLECNCRLGDPETQVILPSIDCDFVALCTAVAEGDLSQVPAPIRERHAACIVLTSEEYPDSSSRSDVIEGLGDVLDAGALLFHAGTARKNDKFVTNKSGRVLNIVGTSETLAEALVIAYDGVYRVQFPGVKFRDDIGDSV